MVLVSLGDAEKLGKFLELNPEIPRSIARVDESMDNDADSIQIGV